MTEKKAIFGQLEEKVRIQFTYDHYNYMETRLKCLLITTLLWTEHGDSICFSFCSVVGVS